MKALKKTVVWYLEEKEKQAANRSRARLVGCRQRSLAAGIVSCPSTGTCRKKEGAARLPAALCIHLIRG